MFCSLSWICHVLNICHQANNYGWSKTKILPFFDPAKIQTYFTVWIVKKNGDLFFVSSTRLRKAWIFCNHIRAHKKIATTWEYVIFRLQWMEVCLLGRHSPHGGAVRSVKTLLVELLWDSTKMRRPRIGYERNHARKKLLRDAWNPSQTTRWVSRARCRGTQHSRDRGANSRASFAVGFAFHTHCSCSF